MPSLLLKVVRSRAVTTIRSAQSQSPAMIARQERIFNTPAKQEVMQNWKPQTPDGPVHDGWALKRWPFKAKNANMLFAKVCVFVWAGVWLPFFVVRYQLKKANAAK